MTLRDLSQTGSTYSFLDLTLDLSAECLTRGPAEIKLRPKSFQVLRYLAERSGRLVTRDELLQAIWPDVVVSDESLTKCIADVRRALNDDSAQVIKTVARRGYVFTAQVTRVVALRRSQDRENEHGLAAAQPTPVQSRVQPFPEMGWTTRRIRRPFWPWTMAAMALVLIPGITVIVIRGVGSKRATVTAAVDYTQLTNFTDAAFSPALSADVRMLTFIRGENPGGFAGKGDVFVKLLPDGEPVQLTRDGKSKMNPTFTPGGDRITYSYPSLMTDPQNWSTWSISVFGGEPKPLLSNASALTWISGTSPPQVLFSRVPTGVHMSIVTSTESGTASRTVYAPATPGMAHRSYLSPDRKHVLVVEMHRGWLPCRLVPFESGAQPTPRVPIGRLVGPSPGQCSSAAWSPDGKWMYFSINTGSGYHIWRQRFPEGTPEQVTFGATEEQEIAFDPDGHSFVTSVGTRQSTLWIHDPRGERQVTSEGYASLPRFSPDGKKLYYLLRSRTNRRYLSGELWSANLESAKREQLFPDFLLTDYSISPDGTRVLFVAIAEDGATSAWLAPLEGRGEPQRVSNIDVLRAFFGASGEVFLHGGDKDDVRYLYRVNEDGSGLKRAISDPIVDVYDVSPDGRLVAAWLGSTVQILSIGGDSAITASAVCASTGGENSGTTPPCVSWSENGRFLYLNDRSAGQAYALPIPGDRNIPLLPDRGIDSTIRVVDWPGAKVVQEPTAFFGPDPSVYAFFRVKSQRNIYRVRVPE